MDSYVDSLEVDSQNPSNIARPKLAYTLLIDRIKTDLGESGAYIPLGLPGSRKSKPLWWDIECNEALERRRVSRKDFLGSQTTANIIKFRKVDEKVKRFLRRKKKLSFTDFCNFLSPSMGTKEIWGKVRAFATSTQPLRTGIINDPDSQHFRQLQNYLVQENIQCSHLPFVSGLNGDELLNGPFSITEFNLAMLQSKKDTAPGMDSISQPSPFESKRILVASVQLLLSNI